MRVIIAGSRSIENYSILLDAIDESGFQVTTVISGRAKGVDRMGETYAYLRGLTIDVFPADWDKHGKAAGYIRNSEMAEHADALIAIWDGKSKGTKNMIEIAKRKGLKVFVKEIK